MECALLLANKENHGDGIYAQLSQEKEYKILFSKQPQLLWCPDDSTTILLFYRLCNASFLKGPVKHH